MNTILKWTIRKLEFLIAFLLIRFFGFYKYYNKSSYSKINIHSLTHRFVNLLT